MLWDMETVYADTLILFNGAVDYLLLLCTGKLCALPLRRGRMLLGAAWGGCYALLAVLWPRCFALTVVKLAAGALAVLLAFGAARRTVRAVAAFYAVAAAFAGAVYAAAGLSGQTLDGKVYLNVSLRVLVLSFALCYAGVSLVFRRVGRRAERRLVAVELELDGRQVHITALEDSGNELTDPLTGNAVLVAGAAALAPLFEGSAALELSDPLAALEAMQAQNPAVRFRLLPCACVAAERALLLCFRPDAVRTDGQARRDLTVAVSPHSLCPDGEYQALL
ncbi:MAG: sigma-E processing peptidase SpoIIGA [Oscillospiraceae bacterium]|nr:sigma-E processing peptidase SpoIIGA [Oscillospiraceae bacterium]MCC8090550.1 sigma-E processing peptidase SpoIIGA [Oscillospiraceae bacterium]